MICKELHCNWRQIGNISDGFDEDYDIYKVGVSGVVKITNVTPTESYSGPEFYDVEFEDGRVTTCYNVNQTFFFPEDKKS